LLAYIDIFSMLFLLGVLSRATTILFILKQVAARLGALASHLMPEARQPNARHRREHGRIGRKPHAGLSGKGEDEPCAAGSFAWA
jgi:hypothetical protein